LRWY